jgi:hypothetical protein
MKNRKDFDDEIVSQKLNIGSAKALVQVLVNGTGVDIACIANALEKVLEPVEMFLEKMDE